MTNTTRCIFHLYPCLKHCRPSCRTTLDQHRYLWLYSPLGLCSTTPFQYLTTVEVEIMAGRKYSTFTIWPWCGDLSIAEMPFLIKKSYYKTTRVIMIDRNKAVSRLFIPGPFLQINTHTCGLMLTCPSLEYMYLKPIVPNACLLALMD